jgi:hypothetical protein
MYLLYLDDAGSAKNTSESHLVLGGICVHESQVSWLTQELDKIAFTYNSSSPQDVEFHASVMFGGREAPWSNIPAKEDRVQAIRDVLAVVANASRTTCTFACAVDKASFPHRDPMEIAFEDLCSRFDQKLRRIAKQTGEKHKGIIILDESAYETTLQELTHQFRTLGTQWNVIKNIADIPLFVDSKRSRCIQLADHIAYAVFRRYNAGDTNYLDVFLSRFDCEGPVLHGLSHKRTGGESCSCPSCFGKLRRGTI